MLARWNNPARSPAVIERIVGDGRVLLWTTTADRAGNDWPIEPSFVLAVREAVRGAARPTSLGNTVTAGERMQRVVQTEPAGLQRPAEPPRRRRAASRCRPSRSNEEPGDTAAPAVEINVPDTRRPGIYRLSWDEGSARHPARYLRGQPRPARERARADRGDGAEVVARAAGRRDRLGPRQRRRTCSRRPAARSGTTWRSRCSSC